MTETAAASPDFTLLHEDAHLLVFDKPAGLLCVPGRGADKQDCLSARVQRRWPEALVVHRLDMGTSGLVLMARDAPTQRALGDAFAARQVWKRYEAIVDGRADETHWQTIDAPMMADWPRRPLQKIDPAGKPSLTRWRTLALLPGATDEEMSSRLLLAPHTGRSHQLRLHLAHIGHPILGDKQYGGRSRITASELRGGVAGHDEPARLERQALHAHRLKVNHPMTGQRMNFEAPIPEDIEGVLRFLRGNS